MTLRPFGSVSSVKSIRSSGLPPCIVLLFAACAPAVPAAAHNRETATKRSLIQPPKSLVPGGWTGAAGVGQARYERGQEPERLVRSGEWGVGDEGQLAAALPTPHPPLRPPIRTSATESDPGWRPVSLAIRRTGSQQIRRRRRPAVRTTALRQC